MAKLTCLTELYINLKTKQCPYCNAKPISYECGNQHTNGTWREFVRFRCGQRIEFCPNFMKEVQSDRWDMCPNNPGSTERIQEEIDKLQEQIDEKKLLLLDAKRKAKGQR